MIHVPRKEALKILESSKKKSSRYFFFLGKERESNEELGTTCWQLGTSHVLNCGQHINSSIDLK